MQRTVRGLLKEWLSQKAKTQRGKKKQILTTDDEIREDSRKESNSENDWAKEGICDWPDEEKVFERKERNVPKCPG
jgi:hypothetical protein